MNKSYTVWVLVVLVVASAIWAVWPEPDPGQDDLVSSSPRSGERDTTAEEVRAAATRISEVEQKIDESSAASREETSQLRGEMTASLAEIQTVLNSIASERDFPDVALQELQQLSERISAIELNVDSGAVGIDYEVSPDAIAVTAAQINWIEPIRPPAPTPGEIAGLLPGQIVSPAAAEPRPPEPALTIPATSVVESTALTSLVGRLPIDGQIESPLRFKLISKAANFTSRNRSVPALSGVIWSGIAYGDLTLSCVRGTLDTITYVFNDGTIHTQRGVADPDDITQGLGWISDARGNPCLPGSLKTNAPAVISSSLATGTLAGIARGYAEAQTERRRDRDGATVTTVTGDTGDYALATAAAAAVSEVDVWIRRRIGQSFDAIFVPAGEAVFIHIEQQIDLDYAPDGRRLAHRRQSESVEARIALGGHD